MKIPKSKKDILVKTYLKYIDYVKTAPDDEKEVLKETVKIFYELDDENFSRFEYSAILDLFQIISNILQIDQPLVQTFKHNDIEYGINPNFNDMTFGEMVDCDTDDIIQQICILYRPILKRKGNKYTIEPYNADIEIYEELKETLTLDIYIGFVGFFLKINQDLLNYTLNSSMGQVTEVEKRNLLEVSGLGLVGSTNYVTAT